MTNKIPYEIVAMEANKLIMRMALSSYYNYYSNYNLYINFIEACGWTDQEYDNETLSHIERIWDSLLKNKPIIWN